MSVTVNINAQAWFAKLDAAVGNGITAAATVLEETVVRSFGTNHGGYRSTPGSPPNSQSGAMRNSFGHTPAAKVNGQWKSVVGSSLAYPGYLDKGATIRPKNTKMLMIPLTEEARRMVARAGSVSGAIARLGTNGVKWIPLVKGRKYLVVKSKEIQGPPRNRVPSKPSGQSVKHTPHVYPAGRKIIDKGDALFLATVGPVRIDPRPWAKPAIAKARGPMRVAFVDAAKRTMGGKP